MEKFFVLVSIILSSVAFGTEFKVSVNRLQEIADYINALNTTWKAEDDFSSYGPEAELSFRLGGRLDRSAGFNRSRNGLSENDEDKSNQCAENGLPQNFDSRKHWSNCSSISHIYDQGNCGSCWAVAVVSAFTDRVCIKSKTKVKALRSIQQMLSCCHKCGRGCQGGWPPSAWYYLKREGAVTGGDYNSSQGCQPYRIKPCAHHVNGTKLPLCSSYPNEKEAKCKLHCYNNKYGAPYKADKVRVKKAYEIDPCAAQNEIYKNGPITSFFGVYEDFYTYKSGVYKYTTGKFHGYHVVRVIGWGVENKTPYWLATNSWNADWGDKGLFKIIRGDSEVLFEDYLYAGHLLSNRRNRTVALQNSHFMHGPCCIKRQRINSEQEQQL